MLRVFVAMKIAMKVAMGQRVNTPPLAVTGYDWL